MQSREAGPALSVCADGLVVRVRLSPGAARDTLGPERTLADGRCVIAARVRAVPERGAANAALEKLLARCAGLPRGRVSVVSGHKDRIKTVHLAGAPAELARAIASQLAQADR